MIIAIPLDENKLDICVSFGRAPYFMFCENGSSRILDNPGAAAQGGAGIKAAQFLVNQGANALITVRCGQNAADVFHAANIAIYKAQGVSAQSNLEALAAGTLPVLDHFHQDYYGLGGGQGGQGFRGGR